MKSVNCKKTNPNPHQNTHKRGKLGIYKEEVTKFREKRDKNKKGGGGRGLELQSVLGNQLPWGRKNLRFFGERGSNGNGGQRKGTNSIIKTKKNQMLNNIWGGHANHSVEGRKELLGGKFVNLRKEGKRHSWEEKIRVVSIKRKEKGPGGSTGDGGILNSDLNVSSQEGAVQAR